MDSSNADLLPKYMILLINTVWCLVLHQQIYIFRNGLNRHSTYYFDDCTVGFQVEYTLFGVHRSVISRNSPLFREMWTLHIPPGGQAEGTSDEHPLILERATAKEFELLLSILYPLKYGNMPYNPSRICS